MSTFAVLLSAVLASVDAGVVAVPALELNADVVFRSPLSTSPLVRDPSGVVTVRDAREARAEAKDASELIATTPGAVVQDSGGAGQRKTLSLRGASPNAVLVLLDGVPLSGSGAATDLARIPTSALDRIEVLRGGASARYGPGAMGGVVNLVTRMPEGPARVFADFTQGSFVTSQLSAGAEGKLLGGEGLIILHGLRSEGTFDFRYDDQPALSSNVPVTLARTNNAALQGGGLLRFRRSMGTTQLDVLAEGLLEERGLAGPVQNPTPTASQRTGRGTGSIRTQTRIAGAGTLSTFGSVRADDTTLNGSFVGAGAYQQLDVGAQAEATYSQLFANRHLLTVLLSGGGEWLRAASSAQWGKAAAMLLGEEFFFDGALSVNASARVDVAGPFVVFSPKAGVVADFPKGFSIRANAGQASRTPSFLELYVVQGTLLPNPGLRPERALTADLTAAWSTRAAALSVTGFGSLYEDLISYEYYPPNLARPFNFQAASVAGVEVEGELRPWSWLEASASYTFMHSQNLRDDPRYYLRSLPFRPAHRVHARIAGGPRWLQGRAEVSYQSLQFTNRTETLIIPPRVLINLGVTVTPWKNPRVTFSAELKNLLDVQTQDLDGYPLPPRAVFFTVGISWEPVGTRDSVVAIR